MGFGVKYIDIFSHGHNSTQDNVKSKKEDAKYQNI